MHDYAQSPSGGGDITLKDKEIIDLYSIDQHVETTEKITDMAIRFNIRGNDVIHALWTIAKDSVWAKLTLDLKEKKKELKRQKAEGLND